MNKKKECKSFAKNKILHFFLITGSEPVRLSPGWEGTGRPDDELNFKDMTMDQLDLELNPPKDR